MDVRRIIIIGVIVVLAAAGITALALRPEVVSTSPNTIPGGLPNTATIEIIFSRRMNRESVIERLTISPQIEVKTVWDEETLRIIPMEVWPAGAEVNVTLAGGARSRIGLPARSGAGWNFRIAPISLAYLWPADGASQLYLLDPETGETRQVTQGAVVLSYEFSPDGRIIYYFAENSLGGSDLFTLNRFDPEAEPERLMSCQRGRCDSPALSPDGNRLAYTRNDNAVWLLDLARDTDPVQISPEGDSADKPMWSSQGNLSYYNLDRLEYTVVSVSGKELSTWPNQSGEHAAWAPGGSALVAPEAYLQETDILRGPSGEAENEVVDPATLEPVRVLSSRLVVYQLGGGLISTLTDDDLAEDFWPVFSPDGDILAFTRRYLDEDRWTPGRQIWLMSLPGSGTAPAQVKPLTEASEHLYTGLVWHPDGDLLAAVRFNVTVITEPPEIWLVGLDGSAIRLVIGGYQPAWIP
ncbi:MAG: Ig-like domain-containing protein [Anaerolineales bacterium]